MVSLFPCSGTLGLWGKSFLLGLRSDEILSHELGQILSQVHWEAMGGEICVGRFGDFPALAVFFTLQKPRL